MQKRDRFGRFMGNGTTTTTRRRTTKKTSTKTNVVFVVDMSSSMFPFRDDVISTFNAQINQIPRGDTVRIVPFNSSVHTPVQVLNHVNYHPTGMTALWDATGHGILLASESNDPMLVIVLTDGEENVSQDRAGDTLRSLIKRFDSRLTLAFMVPPNKGDALANKLGISRANITEWEATSAGYAQTMKATNSALGTYFYGRGQGMTKTASFYTDASKVTPQALSQSLERINGVQSLTVPSEIEIRDFFQKQGLAYSPGSSAYQLTKPETVQSYKAIFIREKGKATVYGGRNVRNLLGLPYTDAKIIPGNHANYDIFVESRSFNRKLVRGTKVLYFGR